MVENIGFRDDATHTRAGTHHQAPLGDAFLPLFHPPVVALDRPAERQIFLRGADHHEGWRRLAIRGRTALRMLVDPRRWAELVRILVARLR
jgi:hypothetical protein